MAAKIDLGSAPTVKTNAQQTPAAATMPTPEMVPKRAAALLILTAALLLTPATGPGQRETGADDPRIAYAATKPEDAVTRLQARLDRGETALKHDPTRGYLPAILDALHIPVSSQTLVFSKTSVQKDAISPETPRALYFGDETYVGYVPNAKSLEVVSVDPRIGPVYYVLLQRESEKPVLFRAVGACLACHATKQTGYVPEHLLLSTYPDADGTPLPSAPKYYTTDESPMAERWGGWYVTGSHGTSRHMGNVLAEAQAGPATMDREKGANVSDLRRFVDTSPYLSPHSDIVALMVLAHQTHMQNLIAQAGYRSRAAQKEPGTPPPTPSAPCAEAAGQGTAATPTLDPRIAAACEALVRGLLLSGEPPLASPVAGTSGFAEQFSALAPRDHRGRALRQLDLKRRLFRYPCSYTIYSEAFDALPAPSRDYIYRRLYDVLTGSDRTEAFHSLSASDRKAIYEILIDTKSAFAQWSKDHRSASVCCTTGHEP
ncbi:MAG TPA: hypothetical protein VKT77_04300 [Chthonomonadaceae bacterium]|nr:hypothetical protein [Chthonomonadaceae bacterium]